MNEKNISFNHLMSEVKSFEDKRNELISASAATLINIRNARKHFEKLEKASQSSALSR